MSENEVFVDRRCVTQTQCSLCHFDFKDGDLVTVSVNHSTFEFEYKFMSRLFFECGKSKAIRLHLCRNPQCQFLRQAVPCLHRACRNITPIELSNTFLAATAFTFEPDIWEKERRKKFLQDQIIQALQFEWARYHLPLELWLQISTYLSLEEYAAIRSESLSTFLTSKQLRVEETILDIAAPISIRRRKIDGISYISSLCNGADGVLIIGESRRIFIGQDYLGVRELLVDRSAHAQNHPHLWWRSIYGSQHIRVLYDGIKVRQVLPCGSSSPHTLVRLSTPGTLARIINFNPKRPIDYNTLRLHHLVCNAPGITGYYAFCSSYGTVSLYPHFPDSSTDFLSHFNHLSVETGVWIYMPVNENEYLKAIHVRLGARSSFLEEAGLIFTTNQKRVVFAPYADLSRSELQYLQLYWIRCAPSVVYLSEPGLTIEAVAFEEWQPTAASSPIFPATISRLPWVDEESWYHSSCNLSNVVEVIPCHEREGKRRHIIGMLLRYRNNRRACIGYYRQDWTTQPLEVCGEFFKIGLARPANRRRDGNGYRVMAIKMDITAFCHDSYNWRQIPWSGILEWWFTRCTSYVSHRP